jgi:D-alanyl-D-alanine-carboxypeptidase/D-alanyl-D-alanine-endopeptidase
MKNHLWLIAIVTIIGWTASAQPAIEDSIRLQAEAAVRKGVFPSLVIGVVQDGRSEIAGFGEGKPDARTVYEIGSLTKTFTALLLADAVDRGVVKLDEPVAQLLPGFTIPASGSRVITLLDLGTQSSGLPRLPANLLPKNSNDPYADYKAADLKAFLSSYKLPYPPGDHYDYSNLGFGLLGEALATKEAMPYARLLRERVTLPLKMNDTMITLTPEAMTRFAHGHDPSGAATSPWNFAALAGCGAVRSTASDLLLYVRAHMHPEGALAKALASVTQSRRKTDRENATIGLAWQIESRGGKTIVWHNGMTGGYASFAGFTADGTRGVVVLTNISRDVTPLGLAALVPQQVKLQKEIALEPGELASYAGRYRLAPSFALDVRVENGALLVQATGQSALPVYASARDEFFYKVVDAQLTFGRDEHGQVNSVTLHQNGRNVRGPREVGGEPKPTAVRKEITLNPATLADYVGRYELAPQFLLDVRAENGQLSVQATGQPSLPVYATARDEFFYKVVDAQLSFTRGADGKVKEVVLHQNGRDMHGAKQ